MTYQEWKQGRTFNTSFDCYKFETGAKEYQCLLLDPELEAWPLEGALVMFETDNLGEACGVVYEHFKKTGQECGVYQERHGGSWREIYQHKDEE